MTLSQLSPGVVIREVDNSTVTTVSNPAFGAIAGAFERGPVNELRIISTEEQFKQVFGKPNSNNFETWFAASQYILYGGTIKVLRTDATALRNAVTNSTAVKIRNLQDYETNFESGNTWFFAAKTPGAYANGIRIYTTDAGPDQILTLDAPASGDEWQFFANDSLSAASGAAGRVYKYSIFLKLTSVVGTFTFDETVTVGGDGALVLGWDPVSKVLEVQLDNDYAGVIIPTDTVSQMTGSAVVSTVTRKILSVTNKGSIDFAAGNDITDDNSNTVNIASVSKEYLSREVFPGLRWASIGTRPGTSPYTVSKNGYRDELHVVVVDTTGTITGTPNTILEKFVGLSKASDAKTTNGEVNYYPSVLKAKSNYIYWGEHNDAKTFSVDANFGNSAANAEFDLIKSVTTAVTNPITGQVYLGSFNGPTVQYVLDDGVDSWSYSALEYETTLNLLADPEGEDIDFIIPGAMGDDELEALTKANAILNVINLRKDCMTFFSPIRSQVIGVSDSAEVTENLTNYFAKFPSTSYAAFDSGYKYIYDAYNDVYRYIPCNGDMAGLCLSTARNSDPWFSPAGFQRGVLRNAIKLAYSPNKAQRDALYSERVNPVVSFPGQGIVLFGDKTALGYASAFDRINVRRLFLSVEKTIGRSAKSLLFSQNDETSRSQFRNFVEPYLRNIQGRRGVTDFLVKCDNTNNTPETVDRGEFYAEIYLKPTRTINYITISFIATRTGVAFEEVAS